MMISSETLENGTSLDFDLCVVGGGAAGISLALQFVGSALRVVLLESGGLKPDATTQALNEGSVADEALHPPANRYRQRQFGGTTTIWSGRCIPYDPIDFETRSWVPHSGWPISYRDVARWYPRANDLCEAGECVYSAEKAVPGGMKPTVRSFAPDHFERDGIERFSPPTDFGVRYQAKLRASENVCVLLKANVVELITGPDGREVERVSCRSLDQRRFSIRARHVVLAAGGIETPRLLLASKGRHPDGLGNQNGQVGRFYMSHIAGTVGALRLDVRPEDINPGYERAEDGVYCRRRWRVSDETQRERGLLNCFFRLHFPDIPDPRHGSGPLSAIYLAKPFLGPDHVKRLENRGGGPASYLHHLRNVGREPVETLGFLWNGVRHRRLADRKYPSIIVRSPNNLFSLDYHGEQAPNPDSRITLGSSLDALGMPRVRIDWRYSPGDIDTAEAALGLFASSLRAWGRGQLIYEPEAVKHHMLRDGAYGGHHIGTTRMSLDPKRGVVDGECRVHGVANLYVAGASVFPTSSQANPTLTVVALALRLADTLKRGITAERRLPRSMEGVVSPRGSDVCPPAG